MKRTVTRTLVLLIAAVMVFALLPALPAQAVSAEMSMTQSRTIAPGVDTTVDVKIVSTGFQLTAVDFTVITDPGLEVTGANTGTYSAGSFRWSDEEGRYEFNVTLYVHPTEDFTGNTKKISIGSAMVDGFYMQTVTVTPEVKDPVTGEVTSPAVTREDKKTTRAVAPATSAAIYMASSNCELSTLEIDGQTVPGFSPSITTYSLPDTEDGYVNVSADVMDGRSKLTGTGSVDLNYGINRINVTVTSEYGNTRTYTVSIKRKDNRSDDFSLESLSADVGDIKFEQGKYSFSVVCDHSVDSVTINAKAADPLAVILSGTGKFQLQDGINSFPVVVKAENEKEKTYTVYVIRKTEDGQQQQLSGNNALSGISVSLIDFAGNSSPLDIQFSEEKDVYVSFIRSGYDRAIVTASPSDPTTVIEVNGGEGLMVGTNDIKITSMSQDASSREYLIRLVVLDETIHVRPSLVDADIVSPASDTVTIDFTEDSDHLVPFDTIKAVTLVNKKLRIDCYDQGIMTVRWSFPGGADIVGENFDASMRYADESGSDRYASRTESREGIHVSFAYSGELPSDAEIMIYVGDKYEDGTVLYMYWFDTSSERFEAVGEELTVMNGYITPPMTHCSQFFITPNKMTIITPMMLMIGGGAILLIALVVFIAVKIAGRKKKEKYRDPNEYENYDEYYSAEEREMIPGEMTGEPSGEAEEHSGEDTVYEEYGVSDEYLRGPELPEEEEVEEEPVQVDSDTEKFLDSLDELFS